MMQTPLHERDVAGQFQAARQEGPFVRWTRALQKFLIGVVSLLALAFAIGLAWGAMWAGFVIAERWMIP